jgi:hypothetical protein
MGVAAAESSSDMVMGVRDDSPYRLDWAGDNSPCPNAARSVAVRVPVKLVAKFKWNWQGALLCLDWAIHQSPDPDPCSQAIRGSGVLKARH